MGFFFVWLGLFGWVCLFETWFLCITETLGLSWIHFVDEAGLRLTEMSQHLLPEC